MQLLHIGDHTHIRVVDLVSHFVEPDHLFFAALTVAVGWCAYMYGRRVEARSRVVESQIKDRHS